MRLRRRLREVRAGRIALEKCSICPYVHAEIKEGEPEGTIEEFARWITLLDDRVPQLRFVIKEPMPMPEFVDQFITSTIRGSPAEIAAAVLQEGPDEYEGLDPVVAAALRKGDAAIRSAYGLGGTMPDDFQELKTGNVFTVGWLYAWRWVAAMLLGGFVGWSLGMLFSGDKSFLVGVVDVVIGVLLMAVFSILYYLERKASTGA